MRFYYQHQDSESDQKVSTKCVRIQSKDTTHQVVESLQLLLQPAGVSVLDVYNKDRALQLWGIAAD